MKRTPHGKLAAQPERAPREATPVRRPRTQADRVRASLLLCPPAAGRRRR